jgi:hypothetical protein
MVGAPGPWAEAATDARIEALAPDLEAEIMRGMNHPSGPDE